jgi:hypothetical protein
MTWGSNGIQVSGAHAFIARGSAGLLVYDVSDPTAPRWVGSETTGGYALNLDLVGGLAYVSNADAAVGLVIMDVSDPTDPRTLGSLPAAAGDDVLLIGSLAYVADYWGEFHVVDVGDPQDPTLVRSLDLPGSPMEIVGEGGYLYVQSGGAGVHVLDISDPTDPAPVATLRTSDTLSALVARRDYGFAACSVDGLRVLDLANPSNPRELAQEPPTDESFHVAVSDDLAFLGLRPTGADVFDISDPGDPRWMSTWDTLIQPWNIAAQGSWLYAVDANTGLHVVDASDPLMLVERGLLPAATEGPRDLRVDGPWAYLSWGPDGLVVADISDPSLPVIHGSVSLSASAGILTLDGTRVYVLTYSPRGLSVVDVSDPAAPVELGWLDLNSVTPVGLLDAAGDRVFLARQHLGVTLIDVSDPARPALVAEHALRSGVYPLAVSGNHLFAGWHGLTSLDIEDCATATAPLSFALWQPDDTAGVGGCSVTLSWQAGTGALTYDLYVDDVDPPLERVATGVPDTEYAISLPTAATWYWKVVAVNSAGESQSEVRSFTTGGTAPASELASSVRLVKAPGDTVRLSWDDLVEPVDDYVVLQDRRPDGRFTNVVASETPGMGSVDIPAPPGLSYYRVAGRRGADCVGPP